MKLNIVINKKVNNIIGSLANNMGTSKRNVISFALSSILEDRVTKEKMEELKENIHLDYKTTVTVNDEFNEKLNAMDRFGLSKSKYYGYLICDYFYNQEDHQCLNQKDVDNEKSYVMFHLDEKEKENLVKIAEAKSMTVNSLFIHYILNEELEMGLLKPERNPVMLQINLTNQVKENLNQNAKKNNVSMQFYLRQIAAKIEKDHQL